MTFSCCWRFEIKLRIFFNNDIVNLNTDNISYNFVNNTTLSTLSTCIHDQFELTTTYLFVLDQVCLVAATNAAFECAVRPQDAGRPAGCRRAAGGRAQAGTKQLHIVCAQMYEYVQVWALSITTKNQL